MKTGVIVGRFQVPYLHDGHNHLLRHVWMECDRVVVVLGSSPTIDERNPLDFHVRADMIRDFYCATSEALPVYEIMDRESDKEWSDYLDRLLDSLEGGIILYGSRDCFASRYHGKYEVQLINEIESPSGTEIRDNISLYSGYESMEDFRKGIIYGVTQLLKNQEHVKSNQVTSEV